MGNLWGSPCEYSRSDYVVEFYHNGKFVASEEYPHEIDGDMNDYWKKLCVRLENNKLFGITGMQLYRNGSRTYVGGDAWKYDLPMNLNGYLEGVQK